MSGPLGIEVASAGEGSCAGGKNSTRATIQKHRERMMGRLLKEGLLHYPDQEARPVWSWPERDKLSSQWLLALPGHDSSLTSEEFTQCVETILCLPSTACAAKIGENVGKARVDKYGDSVVAEKVKGDGFRRRHDTVKNRIVSLHKWAGIKVKCEVFNLFLGLIPPQGLSRLEAGRKRQGLVPAFLVKEPAGKGEEGEEETVLAELKVISSCPTRYSRNPRAAEKAVDRRASTLPEEFNTHAKNIDRVYGGVPVGEVGPVQAKLQSFPTLRRWVFGASEDIHDMVDYLAEARLAHVKLLQGRWRRDRVSDEAEVAGYKGEVRKRLSPVTLFLEWIKS